MFVCVFERAAEKYQESQRRRIVEARTALRPPQMEETSAQELQFESGPDSDSDAGLGLVLGRGLGMCSGLGLA